ASWAWTVWGTACRLAMPRPSAARVRRASCWGRRMGSDSLGGVVGVLFGVLWGVVVENMHVKALTRGGEKGSHQMRLRAKQDRNPFAFGDLPFVKKRR